MNGTVNQTIPFSSFLSMHVHPKNFFPLFFAMPFIDCELAPPSPSVSCCEHTFFALQERLMCSDFRLRTMRRLYVWSSLPMRRRVGLAGSGECAPGWGRLGAVPGFCWTLPGVVSGTPPSSLPPIGTAPRARRGGDISGPPPG